MIKNNIYRWVLGCLTVSFGINFYIEYKLNHVFQCLKVDNTRDLEKTSNKNFYKYGIENIGENLKRELITMNVDECSFRVRKDYFYLFQNKTIYITNRKKCLKVIVSYHPFDFLFKIKGFQNCN